MQILIQRVNYAQIKVENVEIASIKQGLLLFLALEKNDTFAQGEKLLEKVLNYRIFSDEQDKMNLSVRDIAGEVLLVSQFTLAANTQKGRRPSFDNAMKPEEAEILFADLTSALKSKYEQSQFGQFAADMKISLCNDGPVTFLLTS